MEIKYHQRTLDLLGREPKFSQQQAYALRAIQLQSGITLPESVAEWFSLVECEAPIRFNDDHVLPIGRVQLKPNPLFPNDVRFGRITNHGDDIAFWFDSVIGFMNIENNLFTVVIENQGVCKWAVELNEQADPPVWTRWNDVGKRWLPCVESFSEFVFARAWDTRLFPHLDTHVAAQAKSITFSDLAHLEKHFELVHIDRSHPGYDRTYRFQRNGQKIRVSQFNPWDNDQSDWYIGGDTLQHLEDAISTVWQLSNLSKALYHYKKDSPQQEIINRIREQRGST